MKRFEKVEILFSGDAEDVLDTLILQGTTEDIRALEWSATFKCNRRKCYVKRSRHPSASRLTFGMDERRECFHSFIQDQNESVVKAGLRRI